MECAYTSFWDILVYYDYITKDNGKSMGEMRKRKVEANRKRM